MRGKYIEITVGILMLLGLVALVFLAFKVSGLTYNVGKDTYYVKANFDNIGGLKVRSPVRMAGVKIGQVLRIDLNRTTYQAMVTIAIYNRDNTIPTDSTASILTEGLLGANYIGVTPGFNDEFMKNGSVVEETHSAIVLENLIGQMIFNMNKDKDKDDSKKKNTPKTVTKKETANEKT